MPSSSDNITVRLKLKGGKTMVAEMKAVNYETARLGANSKKAGLGMMTMNKIGTAATAGIRAVGKAAKWAAVGVGALAVIETPRMVNAYRDSYKVGRQTNAVIKSTGGVANVTASQLSNYANSLSLMSAQDDELIQSGGNLLLTFTKVRNEVGKGNDIYRQALTAALDLSAATGNDLKGSVLQLGKALNDPASGLTALRRSGVSFTNSQKDMIAALFESGKRLKAQKLILREVNKEFAGSARANADPFSRFSVALENLEEEGGRLLFPFLSKAANGMARFFNQMRTGKGAGGEFIRTVRDIGTTVGDVSGWISNAYENTKHWVTGTGLPAVVSVGRSVVSVVTAIAGAVASAGRWIGRAASNTYDFVRSLYPVKAAILAAKIVLGGLILGVKALLVIAKPFMYVIGKGIGRAAGMAGDALGILWNSLKTGAQVFGDVIGLFSNLLRGKWSGVWRNAKQILVDLFVTPFKNTLKAMFDWFADKIGFVIDKINSAKSTLDSILGKDTEVAPTFHGLPTGPQSGLTPNTGDHNGNSGTRSPRRAAVQKVSASPKAGANGKARLLAPITLRMDGQVIANVVAETAEDAAALA